MTIFSSTDVICTLNYLLGGGRIWCMASSCAVVVTGFVQKLKIICQPLPNYTTNHPTTRPPYKIFPEKNGIVNLLCNYNTHIPQYDHWPCTPPNSKFSKYSMCVRFFCWQKYASRCSYMKKLVLCEKKKKKYALTVARDWGVHTSMCIWTLKKESGSARTWAMGVCLKLCSALIFHLILLIYYFLFG